jgi:hypothetical protein
MSKTIGRCQRLQAVGDGMPVGPSSAFFSARSSPWGQFLLQPVQLEMMLDAGQQFLALERR